MSSIKLASGRPRETNLDLLRGFALLGILVINVRGFAFPEISMVNPNAVRGSGLDHALWLITTVLAQTKSMDVFALLMGYSYYRLFLNIRAAADNAYFRILQRFTMLLLLGCLHLFVLWYGDVLVLYSLGAIILFPMVYMKRGFALFCGIAIYLFPIVYAHLDGIHVLRHPEYADWIRHVIWRPSHAIFRAERTAFSAPFFEYLSRRLFLIKKMQLLIYPTLIAPQFVGCFLIGMALHKLEVERAERFARLKRLGTGFFVSGFLLSFFGILIDEHRHWEAIGALYFNFKWNYIGALFVAIGLLLLAKSHQWKFVDRPLVRNFALAGRLSLTHYVCQSMFCGLIFYGWGLGLYDKLSLTTVLIVSAAIWVVQMLFSGVYFNFFNIGPLEAVVRRVPIKRITNKNESKR